MELRDDDLVINSGLLAVSVMWVNPHNQFDNAIAEASQLVASGDDNWYVNRVKVRMKSRYGQGIGSYVFEKLMEVLRARGAVRVIVEPGGYGSDVERLIGFYGRFGFQLRGEGPEDPYMCMEWRADA